MIAIDSLLCSQHLKNKEFTEVHVERGLTGDSSGGMPSSPAVLPDFRVSIAFMASWSFRVTSSQVFFRCSGMRLIAAS